MLPLLLYSDVNPLLIRKNGILERAASKLLERPLFSSNKQDLI